LTDRAAWARDVAAAAALALVPIVAALAGSPGPVALRFNLGPGDAPYLRGFAPEYEIDAGVATRWTTYDAAIALPVEVRGGPVDLAYRYTRSFGETAVVDVSTEGRAIDRFSARGGAYVERTRSLGALPWTPLALEIRADSHERRNLGLKMDWVLWQVGEQGRLRLTGWARLRAALAVALAFVILRLAGWTLRAALAFVVPMSLGAAYALHRHAWLGHRLLDGIVPALAVGVLVVAWGHYRVLRDRLSVATLQGLSALGLVSFLVHAVPLNHPDFYYPDLRTHAAYAAGVREDGGQALLDPVAFTREHGIWKTEYEGRDLVFPYPFTFHALVAALPVPAERLIPAMKVLAAGLTVAALAATWMIAQRLGASPLWAGALMIVLPTYGTRLSLALFAALFGHVFDAGFLAWLSRRLPALGERRYWIRAAALVAACELAYVSGVLNVPIFLAVLTAALFATRRPRLATAMTGALALGSLLALALYYRHYVVAALRLAGASPGGGGGGRYARESFVAVLLNRTDVFFGPILPLVAVAGLVLLYRRLAATDDGRVVRLIPIAWTATYLALLLGRSVVPDVFLHGHETLFATPLVAVAVSTVLVHVAQGGRAGRVAAALGYAAVAYWGLTRQAWAVAEQLRNAS
jgi:hypothetical protein